MFRLANTGPLNWQKSPIPHPEAGGFHEYDGRQLPWPTAFLQRIIALSSAKRPQIIGKMQSHRQITDRFEAAAKAIHSR